MRIITINKTHSLIKTKRNSTTKYIGTVYEFWFIVTGLVEDISYNLASQHHIQITSIDTSI